MLSADSAIQTVTTIQQELSSQRDNLCEWTG